MLPKCPYYREIVASTLTVIERVFHDDMDDTRRRPTSRTVASTVRRPAAAPWKEFQLSYLRTLQEGDALAIWPPIAGG